MLPKDSKGTDAFAIGFYDASARTPDGLHHPEFVGVSGEERSRDRTKPARTRCTRGDANPRDARGSDASRAVVRAASDDGAANDDAATRGAASDRARDRGHASQPE